MAQNSFHTASAQRRHFLSLREMSPIDAEADMQIKARVSANGHAKPLKNVASAFTLGHDTVVHCDQRCGSGVNSTVLLSTSFWTS